MTPDAPNAPTPAPTGLRRASSVVRLAFGLVWDAAPSRLVASLAPQAAGAIAAGTQLVVLRDLIAAVLASGNGGELARVGQLLAYTVGLTLAVGVINLIQGQQQQMLSAMVERHTNSVFLDRIIGIDLKHFETPEFQDLARRAQNALFRIQTVTATTIGLARSALLIVGVAAALYVLQPVLLAIALAGSVPMWVASVASSRHVYRWWRSMTPNERSRNYVFGLFTQREYAKEVRALDLAPYLRSLYNRLSNDRIEELRRNLRRRGPYQILSSGAAAAVTALTYGVLAYLVIERRIGAAEAAAAVIASQQLNSQLSTIVDNATQLYEASLFLEDWQQLAAFARSARHTPIGPATAFERINCDHVSFCYPGSTDSPPRPAIDDVCIEIKRNEVVALVGENGSGKTTLAKVLSGLYTPDSGRVLWDDADVGMHDPEWVRQRVAVLFQDFARFMLTARENIGLGRVERLNDDTAIRDAARRAGADTFIDSWADGYDTMLGPVFIGGKDVSMGQWQRIALARAFFRDAPLVILDEPTAALDARAEHDLFTHMRDLFAGRAVLLISHRFSSVRSADRIYVLHEGRIVEQGTHDDLMALGSRYAESFKLQASAYFADI